MRYSNVVDTPTGFLSHATAVVPNDAADLPVNATINDNIPKGLYIGTGGDVTVIGANAPSNATGITFKNMPSGSFLPMLVRRVLATGTTAADIVAVF